MVHTRLFRVADNDFNRAWYKGHIGKIYGTFRGYMLMQEICRPTRAEWRAMWRCARQYGMDAQDVMNASPSLRLAIECRIMRKLTFMELNRITDTQQRLAQHLSIKRWNAMDREADRKLPITSRFRRWDDNGNPIV